MRYSIRLLLLLIISIALRGLGGAAFAMPAMNLESVHMSDCAEHAEAATPPQAHHSSDDKACQIACDLSALAALPSGITFGSAILPAILTPTLTALDVGNAAPPDHPPPIR